jgi:hypothetical protein
VADADTTPTEGNESTTDTPEPTEGTVEEPTTETQPNESPDDLVSKLRSKTQESTKYQKRAQKAESELEKLRTAQLSEQEKLVVAARQEGLTEGMSKANQRLVRAEVIATAAGKVADPGDVFAILTADGTIAGIEIDDDGNVDTKAITKAVDDLVKAKPHLASQTAPRDPDFGARSPTSPQMNADQAFAAWLDQQRRR